jgi:hypothetical protein
VFQPYALAALRYFREAGNAELRYEHSVVPNPLAGSSFLIDGATLRVGLPFPEKTRLFFSGTLGFQWAQTVGEGIPTGSAAIGTADASLAWQATTWLAVFARYDFLLQRGRTSDREGMLPNIERQLVLIGVGATYPTQPAARVPRRQGQRVDRADMAIIPEPHSPIGPR